ncbi:MAG: N-acetylmuramoyl-L-alanine amidase [Oscillospiraceae bacterium]|nr:N-acetylmuramoyl-L-alanine amidase [Oscillospiraceae bacterium]MCI2036006.1 N-acetylmuramoyl-L-alanine amidase [Oscillospiraceae bacterium]
MKTEKSNFVPIAALILCCLAFLLLSYITCSKLSKMAAAPGAGMLRTVVVDAGHGGEDGGATGKSVKPEKDINLAIAKDLQDLLLASGYRVVMTRTDDTAISDDLDTVHERKVSDIHNRLKIIEAQGNCIFVSIHQNQFEQGRYHGTQVFYSKNTEQSKELAESIKNRVVGLLQKDNERQTKPATSSIYLLWHATVPAVLVECGFLSNEEEAARLNRPEYQRQMAFAIYCGLLDFCSAR